MGKALGLLPSWYWPEGVQRYVSAPRVAIYELAVNRWAKRYGNDPALISPRATTSFRELDGACQGVAARCAARFPEGPPKVALAIPSGEAFAPLFFGLLRANATLLLLEAADSGALREFEPDLVISAMEGVAGEPPGTWLEGEPAPAPARPPAMADASRPAIALPGSDGLAWHSQASLMSAAMAFAAFAGIDNRTRLLVVRPPGSWEGLTGLLAPLQAGGAALVGDASNPGDATSLLESARPATAWVDAARAELQLDSGDGLAAALRAARPHLFVTVTKPFPRPLRRDLRHRLRCHILTVYGYPECGAIAASHPSWYLDDAIGIPMAGTDLLALNPTTGQPSDLPWPVLSYAGIGAKSQAVATNRRTAPPGDAAEAEARWFVTGDHGLLDANGMLFLRERPPAHQER